MVRRKKKSKAGRAARIIGGVALAGGALYAGEKLAERMGVRGGAGFIGKRKGSRRKKSAGWFAREIARLKLKKRYDKLKIGA
jgi:ribosomal protein S6E (S10)